MLIMPDPALLTIVRFLLTCPICRSVLVIISDEYLVIAALRNLWFALILQHVLDDTFMVSHLPKDCISLDRRSFVAYLQPFSQPTVTT